MDFPYGETEIAYLSAKMLKNSFLSGGFLL